MNTGVFFGFLALLSVLAPDVAADWPLLDTMFLRVYNRTNDTSYTDFGLKNTSDIVSRLDKSKTTVIYIHGFLQNVDWDDVKNVAKALLKYTSNNVLSLDYRQIALIYPVSVEYVPQIGAALATAINDMAKAGLNATDVQLVGLSLGGQISGYTGRNTTVKLRQIIAVDPAGPGFGSGFVSKADALFVSIIHTDMDGYGNGHISGHADYKVNLGRRIQPGCTEEIVTTLLPPDVCSHLRSFVYLLESIANPNAFPSIQCNSDYDFYNGTCDKSNITPMGYYTPDTASGVYYCQTNSKSPYGLGMLGTTYNYRI
ncbi:pancreatic triacylglycerol lipase-like [Andrena cerasifolii]|uniref:pancreatic triacylglycerol lipase-like n=1 Tax=Andrena cerasifolii TaxID=2819439 RepID=UPI0040379F0B